MKIFAVCVIAACLAGCATGQWVNVKNPGADWNQDNRECQDEAKTATVAMGNNIMNSSIPAYRQIDLWKRCVALKGWWYTHPES